MYEPKNRVAATGGNGTLPKVSICIPAYNAERVIRSALESVISQSYPNREIIFLDDGSSDDTMRVAHQAGGEGVLHLRNDRNLGGYPSMNRLIQEATGDFIAIYHADDIYEPLRWTEYRI